jgi:hypothetical protein
LDSWILLRINLDSCLIESESYVTTGGQSASLSWYKAPIRGLRPDFFFLSEYGIRLTVTFLIPWGALSDERTGLSFVCAAAPCQRSLSRVLVPWDLRTYFTVSDLRLPFSSPPTARRVTVEVFYPASTRVAPPALALEFINEVPFITTREPNRDHRIQGFHCCFSWMRCLGNVHEPLPSNMGNSVCSSTIPAFRQCLPSRCQANGHIPSQYYNCWNTVAGVISCTYQYFSPIFSTEMLTEHFKLYKSSELQYKI